MRRVLLALALVSSCAEPAYAERCKRYVPIVTPCEGLGGPRSRIIAGRAAVPALASCRADVDAERKLRTVDARAAAARLALLQARLDAVPLPTAPTPVQALPSSHTSPIVWLAVGFAGGLLAAFTAARLTEAPR